MNSCKKSRHLCIRKFEPINDLGSRLIAFRAGIDLGIVCVDWINWRLTWCLIFPLSRKGLTKTVLFLKSQQTLQHVQEVNIIPTEPPHLFRPLPVVVTEIHLSHPTWLHSKVKTFIPQSFRFRYWSCVNQFSPFQANNFVNKWKVSISFSLPFISKLLSIPFPCNCTKIACPRYMGTCYKESIFACKNIFHFNIPGQFRSFMLLISFTLSFMHFATDSCFICNCIYRLSLHVVGCYLGTPWRCQLNGRFVKIMLGKQNRLTIVWKRICG